MPLYGTGYIFSKGFFTGWIVVGIVWIFCTLGAIGLYPLWESRATLARVLRVMFTGKSPASVLEAEAVSSGAATPVMLGPDKAGK